MADLTPDGPAQMNAGFSYTCIPNLWGKAFGRIEGISKKGRSGYA
jgi:hypothetical protein